MFEVPYDIKSHKNYLTHKARREYNRAARIRRSNWKYGSQVRSAIQAGYHIAYDKRGRAYGYRRRFEQVSRTDQYASIQVPDLPVRQLPNYPGPYGSLPGIIGNYASAPATNPSMQYRYERLIDLRTEPRGADDFTPGERYKGQYWPRNTPRNMPQEEEEAQNSGNPRFQGYVNQSSYRYITKYVATQDTLDFPNTNWNKHDIPWVEKPGDPDTVPKEQKDDPEHRDPSPIYPHQCRTFFYKGRMYNTCDVRKKKILNASKTYFSTSAWLPRKKSRNQLRLHQHSSYKPHFRKQYKRNYSHKRSRFAEPYFRNRWY